MSANEVIFGGTIGVPGRHGRRRVGRRGRAVPDSRVGGEQVGKPLLGGEPELEDDVRDRVVVVVDLDLVQDLWIEREPVGTVGGLQERVHAEDHGHARRVVAPEGVDVGDVRLVIEGGDRRLAMVRGRRQERQREDRRKKDRYELLVGLHFAPGPAVTPKSNVKPGFPGVEIGVTMMLPGRICTASPMKPRSTKPETVLSSIVHPPEPRSKYD